MKKKIASFAMIITMFVTIMFTTSLFRSEVYAESTGQESYTVDSAEEAYELVKAYVEERPFPLVIDKEVMRFLNISYHGDLPEFIDQIDVPGAKLCRTVRESTIEMRMVSYNIFQNGEDTFVSFTIAPTFRTGNFISESLTEEKYNQGIEKAVELASQFNYGTDYEKALRAYKYVTSTISYDYSKKNGSVYSGLILNSTVCMGFAQSFQAICENMGLEVYTNINAIHAYNIIKLDGQYYIADCTGDKNEQEGGYDYCFIGSQDFTSWSYWVQHNQTCGLTIASKSYKPELLKKYNKTTQIQQETVPPTTAEPATEESTTEELTTEEPTTEEPTTEEPTTEELTTEKLTAEETTEYTETIPTDDSDESITEDSIESSEVSVSDDTTSTKTGGKNPIKKLFIPIIISGTLFGGCLASIILVIMRIQGNK